MNLDSFRPRVAIYFRPHHEASEEARRVLERVRPYEKFELDEVDITGDPVKTGLYGERIPVVTINGPVAFRDGLNEDRFLRRLRLAREQMGREEEDRLREVRRGR